MERTILHCDLNGFFASVELLAHPELRERPVAVCGDPASRHGIVLAKNEAAKAYGVKTAETIWSARKKCPDLVFLPAHHRLYTHYSRLVNEIYGRYSDLVEPFGIDESWLDVTGSMHLFGGSGRAVADTLRRVVREELSLTISVGVSFNKVFAKLGSDLKKPDATTVIPRDGFEAIVWPLPVTELLFVGRTAARTLERFGVRTIGELAKLDRQTLTHLLGKQGGVLHDYANGLERSPVAPAGAHTAPKSVGNGLTFPRNLVGRGEIYAGVADLADSVGYRLRKHGYKCATLGVTIRSPQFKDITRQAPLPYPTCTAREITAAAMALIEKNWNLGAPIRALTITGMNLIPEGEVGEQLGLFDAGTAPRRARQERLERTMDAIRAKYGHDMVGYATGHEHGAGTDED